MTMLLRKHLNNQSLLMKIGMSAFLAGILSLRFAARIPHVTPDLADGVSGFFYGIAIPFMLLSVRAGRRRHVDGGGGPRP
jgi:hypothetical protein